MLEENVEKIFLIGDGDHVDDPKIYDEVMSDIDYKKWLNAIKSEIDSIYESSIDLSLSTRGYNTYYGGTMNTSNLLCYHWCLQSLNYHHCC